MHFPTFILFRFVNSHRIQERVHPRQRNASMLGDPPVLSVHLIRLKLTLGFSLVCSLPSYMQCLPPARHIHGYDDRE